MMTAPSTNIPASISNSKMSFNNSDHSASSSCDAATTLQEKQQQRSSCHRKLPPMSPSHSFSSRGSSPHDHIRVVTPFQLEALELLPTTPIWIFDFYKRRNVWANAAGLKLWDSPDLEEFVGRGMSDMSETARVRTQKLMDRVEQGQYVPEQWTFYPKGKAKTVNVKFSAVRLSPDDEHCVLLGVAIPMMLWNSTSSARKTSSTAMTSASSTVSLASSTQDDEQEEEEHEEDLATLPEVEGDEKSLQPNKFQDSTGSLQLHSLENSTHISAMIERIEEAESKCCEDDGGEEHSLVEMDPVQQENLRVAEIIRYLPTSVCQFDMKGNVMYQNPAAYLPEIDYHQESKEEETSDDSSTRSCFLRRFVDTKIARDALQKLTDDSSSTTAPSINIEAELYTNEKGRTQWSGIQLRKTLDPVTSEPVILFSSFDRSDAIEAERQRKARIEESEFIAIMAHEIRTPLHQVTGFIDLLECCSDPKDVRRCGPNSDAEPQDPSIEVAQPSTLNKEQREYIKLLRSSACQLMTVINDVLDYSKLEAGQMKIERIPFEPMAVVQGSMAAVRQSCVEKGIELTLKYGETHYMAGTGDPFAIRNGYSNIPFRVLGDPNRLRQILLNLLSNAVKFTEKGGIHVHVSTYVNGRSDSERLCRHIQFVVTDTGSGIPQSKLGTVFQKYQQANASDARKHGGTGLGLAICQSLAEKLGGTIGVDSQVGKGSSFWLCLPVATPKATKASITREIKSPGIDMNMKPLNVLVVEDNKINQKVAANMLKRMGHKATLVDDGQQAIDLIQKMQQEYIGVNLNNSTHRPTVHCFFDAVLMDIQMPVMDGLEATRRLRLLGYKDLPIFGLTASQKRSDFTELGFDDWLPKPIPMNDLSQKLHSLRERQKCTGSKECQEIKTDPVQQNMGPTECNTVMR